jgi:hypothetical protein
MMPDGPDIADVAADRTTALVQALAQTLKSCGEPGPRWGRIAPCS